MSHPKESTPSAPNVADEFEAWWATYRHRNRDLIGYNMKKFIAFEAFQAARASVSGDQ